MTAIESGSSSGGTAPGMPRVMSSSGTFDAIATTTGNDNQLNTAVVSATTPPGNPPVGPDNDDAPYNIYNPDISISKTVYAGHNGGASCPGSEMVQVAADRKSVV